MRKYRNTSVFYSDKQKTMLGRIFKFYRKQKGITPWEYIRFNNVCSDKTYADIENGYPKQSYECYDALIELYELKYIENKELSMWLDHITIDLFNACMVMNQRVIKEISLEVENRLKAYNEYVIFSEYYQMFLLVFKYYANERYLTSKEVDFSLSLMEIFDDEIKIILLEVVAVSNSNYLLEYDTDERIYELLKKYEENPVVNYYYAIYITRRSETLIAINIHGQLMYYWKTENNDYRFCKSLLGKFNAMWNMSIDYMLPIIEELDILMTKLQSQLFIDSINYSVGAFYYTNGMFEKTIERFVLIDKIEKDHRVLLMICVCRTYMKTELPAELNVMELDDSLIDKYLKYFKMKLSNAEPTKLERYIMTELIKCLKMERFEHPLWRLFEQELLEFNTITKNYSIHRKYLAKMRKIKLSFD